MPRILIAPPGRAELTVLAAGFVLLLLLEATTLDLKLAAMFFDAGARVFPWRDHWLLTRVSHDGLRMLSAIALVWLGISLWRPLGVLRRLPLGARCYLFGTVVLCLVLIPLAKRASFSHCPWDLAIYGGQADYLRLLQWPAADALRGRCLPAGHAVAGFAYMAGWFALRPIAPKSARMWLAGSIFFGLWAGLAQQIRGAHFLSHTLWSAWMSFALSALVAAIVADRPLRARTGG
jgi:membrane-associated PAP2 superfamily phosphatase